MREKYLVEFLAQWIRDEDLRCRVLRQEKTELEKWGLTDYQRDDLLLLDMDHFMEKLRSELEEDFKIDFAAMIQDIEDSGGLSGTGPGLAGAAYEEGSPHVRGVEPKQIKKDVPSIVIVRGHGWDDTLKVSFAPPGAGQEEPGELLDVNCDADVWQRAILRVKLSTLGKWKVVARVDESPVSTESKESVELEVI